jgi:hypothetical protein
MDRDPPRPRETALMATIAALVLFESDDPEFDRIGQHGDTPWFVEKVRDALPTCAIVAVMPEEHARIMMSLYLQLGEDPDDDAPGSATQH